MFKSNHFSVLTLIFRTWALWSLSTEVIRAGWAAHTPAPSVSLHEDSAYWNFLPMASSSSRPHGSVGKLFSLATTDLLSTTSPLAKWTRGIFAALEKSLTLDRDDLSTFRGGRESAATLVRFRMARERFMGSRHTKMQLSPLTWISTVDQRQHSKRCAYWRLKI